MWYLPRCCCSTAVAGIDVPTPSPTAGRVLGIHVQSRGVALLGTVATAGGKARIQPDATSSGPKPSSPSGLGVLLVDASCRRGRVASPNQRRWATFRMRASLVGISCTAVNLARGLLCVMLLLQNKEIKHAGRAWGQVSAEDEGEGPTCNESRRNVSCCLP